LLLGNTGYRDQEEVDQEEHHDPNHPPDPDAPVSDHESTVAIP
jgi:hypothetical protein